MKVVKNSKQRDSILKFLVTRTDHPTAEFIYNNVKTDFPNISLGTVYRNLSLLCELGLIQKIDCGNDSDHYDGNVSPHYHFTCNKCGCVSDIHMDNLNFINTLASANFKGEITGHSTVFFGTCENCFNYR